MIKKFLNLLLLKNVMRRLPLFYAIMAYVMLMFFRHAKLITLFRMGIVLMKTNVCLFLLKMLIIYLLHKVCDGLG